ncbi:shikimate kinase AroK [Beggiatoa leptomitoformis]|uniref:Shikimate kinase n=1 Tax=Beggiatoa leptomitoformis TaxID=288004 RepID=A0A2N9YD71_9GAMM|nr:shikimate kinase AroK [Beggiatoa leptomitoformis]ALG69560.2 shikimate kinase AroK [Beggiatoa leptomitoformis]AUI68448.1 shikimate kinase AroK [Beggiatoa leptomitoformis]
MSAEFKQHNNIFLVGLMGVGKTTIGRQLAAALEVPFKDSDKEIEERTGASVSLIFEVEGEAGFRKREAAMIAELTAQKGIVLATGGGAVLNPENRNCLQDRGLVVYLHASIEELLKRTAHSRNRPLLENTNPRERLETLFNERHPFYKSVADLVVDTEHHTVKQVVKFILKRIDPTQDL